MDITAFSDDNFDAKEWINKTFRSAEAQDNKEAFVSSLVMKLQLYVQQVNSALEDTSQQVLQSLPRLMRDAEVLHQEACILHDKMQLVKGEISKVEQDTGQSMAALERLDQMKMELQAAKQAWHEADNWTVLATDLEEVFESGDIESISNKLASMQQSLQILANVPDYEDRKLQLEGLKNRLEALASPLLVQAFTSCSAEQSRTLVRVFSAIDRLPELLKYFHQCQRGALVQQWRVLVEVEQDEGITEWMRKFYDVLLSNWHDQVKWCSQVFSSTPINTLLQLYADVLTNIDPSFNTCIDAALKQQSDVLTYLVELKQITRHFVTNFTAALDTSMQENKEHPESLFTVAKAVYFPYVPYISKYATYEQSTLLQQLSALKSGNTDLMNSIHALGQSVPRAMLLLSQANTRCLDFSEGTAYPGLVKAMKVFLSSYLEQFAKVLSQLAQQKGEQEDWGVFQMCLTFLQNVGELVVQLKQLDSDLTSSFMNVTRKLQQGDSKSTPFVNYKQLFLTSSGQRELESLVTSVQKFSGDELQLLEFVEPQLKKLCSDVHHTTVQVIFSPISSQLETVQSAPAWNSNNLQTMSVPSDLPDFSFVPQEYITQIGQYLMTLPQHLEPFLLRDNPALNSALRAADSEYDILTGSLEGGFADILLGIVARSTCQMYCDNILGICELTPSACKQLSTDIDYLGNVFEDLGLSLSDHLQQVVTLLRLPSAEYQSKSSGCSPRLVAAVRQMRNLTFAS